MNYLIKHCRDYDVDLTSDIKIKKKTFLVYENYK